VRGKENVKKVKGAIFAVNHASFLDPVFAGCALPRPMYYLARKTLVKNKFCEKILRQVNAVPFNRDTADSGTIKYIIQLLKEDKLVLVFPEGTRSYDGKLQSAHLGIGLIAIKANVPIIPAYIRGSYDVWPRHKKIFRIAKVAVTIGEPISLDLWKNKPNLEKSDYTDIANLVMAEIADLAHRYN
jgi:1-acyl-sn-glycerol-3-phosphate acyltransferase